MGDVNNDKLVNVFDIVELKKYLMGKSVIINETNSDMNNDSEISTADFILLSKFLLGIKT